MRDVHRVLFDKLAEKLQISTYDDWYQHNMKEVVKIGGFYSWFFCLALNFALGHEISTVLHGYRSCLHDALRYIYPGILYVDLCSAKTAKSVIGKLGSGKSVQNMLELKKAL